MLVYTLMLIHWLLLQMKEVVPAESGGNLAIVSIDPVKRLMSGTFNFKAFRQVDGTQKIITEGVFNNIPY